MGWRTRTPVAKSFLAMSSGMADVVRDAFPPCFLAVLPMLAAPIRPEILFLGSLEGSTLWAGKKPNMVRGEAW